MQKKELYDPYVWSDMVGKLDGALMDAIDCCWNELDDKDVEEHGGIILFHKEYGYIFIKLRNENAGTDIAPGLFTADREDYAEQIIPMFSVGWRHYASFHTHPQFLPYPSSIDMNTLFPGFPINYIFSGLTGELMKYTWKDPKRLDEGVIPERINFE